MAENYKLTSANIPGRRTHSVYADILREFRESGEVIRLEFASMF